MKNSIVVLGGIATIGLLLFAEQVLSLFSGMSPLESLKLVWTFLLHIAATSAIGFVAVSAVKLAKPFLRPSRRVRRARQAQVSAPRAASPRVGKDALIAYLAAQAARRSPRAKVEQTGGESIRFE